MFDHAPLTWTFNRRAVLEQLDDDDDLLSDVVEQFLADAPAALAAIDAAIDAVDGEALAAAAHSLKGAAGYLGADVLCRAAERLESLGRTGRAAEAAHAHREFSTIAEHVLTRLREAVSSSSCA